MMPHPVTSHNALLCFPATQVVLYMLLTWRDPRARLAIERATEAALTNASYNNGNGCEVGLLCGGCVGTAGALQLPGPVFTNRQTSMANPCPPPSLPSAAQLPCTTIYAWTANPDAQPYW